METVISGGAFLWVFALDDCRFYQNVFVTALLNAPVSAMAFIVIEPN